MNFSVLIVFLVLLLIASGFFSASETILFSLSPMKVKAFKKEKDRKKHLVAELLSSPKDLIVTIIMVNVVVNILIQNVVSNIFGSDSHWWLNIGVPLGLTLIFGEFIPKSIGIANNQKWAPFVAWVLSGAAKVLTPVRYFFTRVTQVMARIMFFFLKREEEISVQELKLALTTSHETGLLNEDEVELSRGYLQLAGANAKDFLRPRDEVLFFDIHQDLETLLTLFVDKECTRIPVCESGLDDVLGMVTAEVFFMHRNEISSSEDLRPYLQKPFYVPETISAKTLLMQLYERKETLALVVDEYGSASGLITLEDLIEVVVGEIIDRRDEKVLYTRSGEDVIIASGKLELVDFEKIFGIPLESSTNVVTVGGWLTEQLGDIPKSGVKYVTQDFLFHVLTAEPTRIRRLYIRRIKRGA